MKEKLELLEELFYLLVLLVALALVGFSILEGMWNELARVWR